MRRPPAFSLIGRLCGGGAQGGESVEQFAAVADQSDPEFCEILGGELRQYVRLYGAIAKRLPVLLQAQAAQPSRNVHADLRRERAFFETIAQGSTDVT
jgi:hypothetical protein